MLGFYLSYNITIMLGHSWWQTAGGYFALVAQSRRHLCLLTLVWDVCLNRNARRTGQRKFVASGASPPGGSAGKSLAKFLFFVSDGYGLWRLP